jgi:enoyl-CoA hydratase
LVAVEIREMVATVTLDDPERRNAITLPMVEEIVAAFDELDAREDVAAVVVTGAGKSFCAGAELGRLEVGDGQAFRRIYEGFLRVARSPLPTIAAVNGAAVGAGMNLALACDVRIAARSARFVTRFLELGLHPGGGHMWMLLRTVSPQQAAAMVLLARELNGEQAVAAGLALDCVEDAQLLAHAVVVAGGAATAPRPLLLRAKRSLRALEAVVAHDEAVALELEAQVWSAKQEFFRERVAALRERISAKRGSSSGA